jgi:riboflavin kinase/FMN adenylyltransferase
MKVISLSGGFKPRLKRTCAAIGIFDGVHRGHQYLIKQMLAAARRLKLQPIVITFFPHPAHVLRPDVKLGYLTSLEDRLSLLGDLGVSTCLVIRFNRSFARILPEKFIQDILVKELGVKAVFVGDGFRFGKKRLGDIALLQKFGVKYGYETNAVSGLKQGREVISSTRIRRSISEGKLNEAARLLGRAVFLSGPVVKGARRGKNLGFPTANVDYEADVVLPKGVYAVQAWLRGKSYAAVANIGTRPSFEKQKSKLYLEVYIFDFSRNIYGQHMKVEFLKKISDEKKFTKPQDLVQKIQKDVILARKYFTTHRR